MYAIQSSFRELPLVFFTRSVTDPAPQNSMTSWIWTNTKKLSTMKEQHCSQKKANRAHRWTHPKLVIVTWWTLLDKGTVVCGYVAMVAVFLQHVDFCFNLLFLLLRHVHHFDGGQLACLHVTALVWEQFKYVTKVVQKKEMFKKPWSSIMWNTNFNQIFSFTVVLNVRRFLMLSIY